MDGRIWIDQSDDDDRTRAQEEGEEVTISDNVIEACARAAHEATRAYCRALGDDSHQPWSDSPDWQRDSCRAGVAGAIAGNTPEQSHASWFALKQDQGWKWGPAKDAEHKEHPAMLPYAQLPPEQRAKDDIYIAVVRAVAKAFGALS